MMFDKVEKVSKSWIQHGPNNDRVYLMKLDHEDEPENIITYLLDLTLLKRYSKIFVKVPEGPHKFFLEHDFKIEAEVPGLYNGITKGYFLGKYFNAKRSFINKEEKEFMDEIIKSSTESFDTEKHILSPEYQIKILNQEDIPELAKIYKEVFEVYPFPIFRKDYLLETMEDNVRYFGVFNKGKLRAVSSSEIDFEFGYAEMTDFATSLKCRGRNLSYFLLKEMITNMHKEEIKTVFTIARATSYGMNKTFGRMGFNYGGTLYNNTLIGESIESMNVWYARLLYK